MLPFRMTPRATAISLALLLLLLVLIVAVSSPIPVISEQYGETSLRFASDRAWALLPGDCVTINWRTEGIESLHVEGHGEIGWGEKPFCPAINAKAAKFAVRTPDGLYREFMLRIEYLPDLLLYLAGFVGVVGSLGLAAFFLITNRLEQALSARWLLVCLSTLMVLGVFLRLNEPQPPRLDVDDGQVKVAMWAEKASLVFPHECSNIHVSATGAQALKINGKVFSQTGSLTQVRHCDREGSTALLEAVGTDGVARQYRLKFFVPWQMVAKAVQAPYVLLGLLSWLALAAVGLPIAMQKALAGWRQRNWTDFLPLLAFAWLVLMLFAPFGFDSPPQRERWELTHYAESGMTAFSSEYRIRPLIRLPSALALAIDSDSFVGFHLVQFAVFTLSMSLLYGIIRKLGARPLYAFLVAVLFFAYPVNDSVTSLRNLTTVTSVLTLLLASWFALDYLERPRRLALAGTMLALLLNVESYEAGLALIIALPCYLWLWRGGIKWRKFNLMLVFFGASALKVGHTILNYTTDRAFYQDEFLDPTTGYGSRLVGQNPLHTFGKVMSELYADTFAGGWLEALESIGMNQWLLPTALALLVVGVVAVYIARIRGNAVPTRGTILALLAGILWIAPAAGVLMWVPAYNLDVDRRLAIYTAIGGAIAVFCLLLLITRPISSQKMRNGSLIVLCLLLMLPALSRLFVQRDHWTRSAWKKANILHQIVETIPRPKPGTQLVLMTNRSLQTLNQQSIGELAAGTVFSSALRLVYESYAPAATFICVGDDYCVAQTGDAILLDPDEPFDSLGDTVILELLPDFSVDLVEDPLARYGWDIDIDYDPSQLYDADAPIPERAHSMLGGALRRRSTTSAHPNSRRETK